jgi:hypothetical protein
VLSTWLHSCAEFGDDFAIYFDASGGNERFAKTSGAEAAVGHKFLKSDGRLGFHHKKSTLPLAKVL